MKDTVFRELYKKLNAEQREAVDAIQGPVMVVAGPGTGKTSILTLRIANILKRTDTPADAILALSFTEAGVSAMRKKLLSIIGPRAYEVRMHTFHSFANDLIKRYPEAFPRIVGSEHMEDLEQVKIVEELLNRHASEKLRPKNNPTYYVLPVIDAIRQLKREAVSQKEFEKLLKHHHPVSRTRHPSLEKEGRSKELAKLYRAYEKELRRRRLYDFEDMITEAVSALEKFPEFKQELQEEYQYILADEHQDANRSQNHLLELLCDYDSAPNLFIVGDEKQAIFRFQGASLENFLYFKRRFPKARIIALAHNYRSQPTVLAAAHSLISKSAAEESVFRTELAARAGHAPLKIQIVEAADERAELAWLAGEIERLIKKGTLLEEIAVLARENKDAEKVERALRARDISAVRRGDANVLDSVRIDALRKLCAAILEPSDDALLAPVLFYDFLKLPALSVIDMVRDKENGLLIRSMARYRKECSEMQKKILEWNKIAHNEPLVEAVERIARESGFIEQMLGREDAREELRAYAAFLGSAERLAERDKRAKLADFTARLARAEAHGIGISASREAQGGVQIMTAHKAKGLEFDAVFIVFAQEGKWGGRRSRALFDLPIYADIKENTKDDAHDERRLFYVALTRARKEALVSWHAANEDGRALLPSRFIFEMEEKNCEHIPLQNLLSGSAERKLGRRDGAGQRKSLAKDFRVPRGTSRIKVLQDKEYLNALFLGQGFAVTHLNNFLECPRKYFFLNLVRLPRAQSGAELYGSAIHTALAAHFNAHARDADKPFADIYRIFEGALRRTHLSLSDFREYLAQGKKELKGYLASRAFSRACWNEYHIAGVMLNVGDAEIELTGNLDKVEIQPDGSVAVIDYKTGKPRTRNEILRKTKTSDGNYYRQLVFYKLLLDSAKKREWNMKTGVIDFIKPAKNGSYCREEFEISHTDVAALETQIADVAASILDLSFLENDCGEKDCEWCRLGQTLA
ncbi:MAG: DNA-dependent ATPase I and helicase II [Parcubacteria group bacterium GW2011_GWA2_47_12]|nr:MAG: DNA-dependent ATPase I and helicase II [Parcubacteria group bacterium GW2011_GWA2_47_12]